MMMAIIQFRWRVAVTSIACILKGDGGRCNQNMVMSVICKIINEDAIDCPMGKWEARSV